ncbi:nuclear transport factor 2 family protein [Mycobacterium conspicuum]|jgi:hypothetical protein|nr:nuclear transport factor 2 family protein [Mycobacterium conspicuum]ORV33473.1 hypothetical protein AWC00_28010 [Mycobacterium conspicuum]CNH56741.1 Uncharacterised protein [Mycobacterium tuberculosis]
MDAQPGDVNFDVADRLAIINLFGAYAYLYDRNELDNFRALFTESPELGLRLHDGATLSEGVDTVMALLALRKGEFAAQNNQRRHALNSFWFENQTAERASGHCYFQVFAIRDGGLPTPDLTGCYEFTAVKQDGVWRFSRWFLAIDQSKL